MPNSDSRSEKSPRTYDAFISYSHAADGRLAPAVQRGLHRFARKLYQVRALRTFRDETGLALTPELWPTIQEALDDSRWFILLASPEAAESRWVNREVEYWLSQRSAERIQLVLTEGDLVWRDRAADFDPERSTALPRALASVYLAEPLYLDLRWARHEDQVDLKSGRFRDGIANIAAPLHGVSKDKLESEDVRRRRRAWWLSAVAVTGLLFLAVAAVVAGLLALVNAEEARRNEAEAIENAEVALSRQLAAQSASELGERPELAGLLAVEAYRLKPTQLALDALLTAAYDSGTAGRRLAIQTGFGGIALDPTGTVVAIEEDEHIQLWDAASGEMLRTLGPTDGDPYWRTPIVFLGPDVLVVGGHETGTIELRDIRSGQTTQTAETGLQSIDQIWVSEAGHVLAIGFAGGEVSGVYWDTTTGEPPREPVASLRGPISPDGRYTLQKDQSTASTARLYDLRTGIPLDRRPVSDLPAAFLPDSSGLVVTASGALTVIDVATLEILNQVSDFQGPPVGLAVGTDGQTVVSFYSDGTIVVRDLPGLSERNRLDVGVEPFGGFASADAQRLLTASQVEFTTTGQIGEDLGSVAVTVVDVEPGETAAKDEFAQPSEVRSNEGEGLVRTIDPTGSWIALDTDEGFVVRDIDGSEPERRTRAGPRYDPPPVLTSTGVFVVPGDRSVRYLPTTGADQELSARGLHDVLNAASASSVVAVSGTSTGGQGLWAWKLPGGEFLGSVTMEGPVSLIAVSDSGEVVAALEGQLGFKQTLVLWRPTSGNVDRIVIADTEGLNIGFTMIAFSPNGRLLAIGGDRTGRIVVVDVVAGTVSPVDASGQGRSPSAVAFSPDSQVLIVGISAASAGDPEPATIAMFSTNPLRRLGPELRGPQSVHFLGMKASGATVEIRAFQHGDNERWIWRIDDDSLVSLICSRSSRNLTPEEWQVFVGETEAYRATCPDSAASPQG